QHRRAEDARLADPGGARHLAVAVERRPAGGADPVGAATTSWQQRGDAGPHRSGADAQWPVALDQRDVPDLEAVDVGDRIVRPRPSVEGDAVVAGAGGQRALLSRPR